MLNVSCGGHSLAGARAHNEDAIALILPQGDALLAKGLCFAVADGVSGSANGGLAARATIRGVTSDYYATPDTWGVAHSLDRVIDAQNRWLVGQRLPDPNARMATTLSTLVLKGRRYFVAHVGDSRVYRLRAGQLEQITTDHVWHHPQYQHVLTRAVGLDVALTVDYHEGSLEAGDLFLLLTDGVWEPLGPKRLRQLANNDLAPQALAELLVAQALQAGGQDNVSAVVLRVQQLPPEQLGDQLASGQDLPALPPLRPGATCDSFRIVELRHESRATRLYRAIHQPSGQSCLLKTLAPLLADDREARAALLGEEWLLRRITGHYFPQVLELAPGERQHLYIPMLAYPSDSLAQRLKQGQRFSAAEVTSLGIRLTKALSALQRLNILHRDIKPDNILLDDDGKVRLIDFGVAECPGVTPDRRGMNPGTPSYMAPERFSGAPADAANDLYAVGVTLYHTLTRHYPYGDIEPFQTPRFGDPVPPSRYQPHIPAWLENVLLKAVQRDPRLRFETPEEFRLALEVGDARPIRIDHRSPLMQRHARWVWPSLALLSLLFNALLLFVLLVR